MTKKELYTQTLELLEKEAPETDTELHFANNFQLLVAVVLSAQCTDKRVNQITPELFRQYPTSSAMADASEEAVYDYIRSVSYPNSKAKYLVGLSRMIESNFSGQVPEKIEELMQLPGVGRKTANVIQAIAFEKPAIAVDTHVFRVSHRIGLVNKSANTPYKVEKELFKNIPIEKVSAAHFWLLYHGRYTCKALRPQCTHCKLTPICHFYKRAENTTKNKPIKE